MKKGEVWKVSGRKGPLTVRLLEDVNDPNKDGFFEAEIIDGKVKFMSAENNLLQKLAGLGTAGDVITMRTTLTRFNQRIDAEADHA